MAKPCSESASAAKAELRSTSSTPAISAGAERGRTCTNTLGKPKATVEKWLASRSRKGMEAV